MADRTPTPLALLICAASVALCAACGGPAERLSQARDLALSGHARAAFLEAKAILFGLGSARSPSDRKSVV